HRSAGGQARHRRRFQGGDLGVRRHRGDGSRRGRGARRLWGLPVLCLSPPPRSCSGGQPARGRSEKASPQRRLMPKAGRERFEAALRAAGAERVESSVWNELVARYGERRRHYHTLEHVAGCLAGLDAYRVLAERSEEVELALWFHDAVYVPWKSDNEERSAELAERWLEAMGVPSDRRQRIARY